MDTLTRLNPKLIYPDLFLLRRVFALALHSVNSRSSITQEGGVCEKI